jgi:hypothetical protein
MPGCGRSSSRQSPMRLNGRLQVIRKRGHYVGRHRACPSDSQEAVLPRARPISKFRVAKTDLGTSTRVVLHRRNLKRADLALNCSRPQFRAPVMHQFHYSLRTTFFLGYRRGQVTSAPNSPLATSHLHVRLRSCVTSVKSRQTLGMVQQYRANANTCSHTKKSEKANHC